MIHCNFCNKIITTEVFIVYKVILITERDIYQIGLLSLLEKLAAFAMKRGYHLSASQIVLLRPDILLEFFREYKPGEEIEGYFLKEKIICTTCYEDYKELIPMR